MILQHAMATNLTSSMVSGVQTKTEEWSRRGVGGAGDGLNTVVRAQELCESRGGRPGLPSLINIRFLWT